MIRPNNRVIFVLNDPSQGINENSASLVVKSPTVERSYVAVEAIQGDQSVTTNYTRGEAVLLIDALKAQVEAGAWKKPEPTAREVFDKLQVGDRFYLTAQYIANELRVKTLNGYINPAQEQPTVQGNRAGGVLDAATTKVVPA